MTNISQLFVQLFLVISLLIFRSFLPQLYPFSEPEPAPAPAPSKPFRRLRLRLRLRLRIPGENVLPLSGLGTITGQTNDSLTSDLCQPHLSLSAHYHYLFTITGQTNDSLTSVLSLCQPRLSHLSAHYLSLTLGDLVSPMVQKRPSVG